MLTLARERAAAEGGVADRVAFIEGSAYEMPFEDASFDLVVATNAIHGFDDLPVFLREARRVLAPDGRLVVLDERRDVSWPVYALMWLSTFVVRLRRKPLDGMGPVIQGCYTRGEVEDALADAGFDRHVVTTGILRLEAWAQA
jgi:ubiquinone/menaquinone biosynthesis C-methylase UbiE